MCIMIIIFGECWRAKRSLDRELAGTLPFVVGTKETKWTHLEVTHDLIQVNLQCARYYSVQKTRLWDEKRSDVNVLER